MYRVRILVDGFVIGSTPYPRGSELGVNLAVYNFLLAERKAEDVMDSDDDPETGESYHRRDMTVEPTAAPKATPKAAPKKRRGRPPKQKGKADNA